MEILKYLFAGAGLLSSAYYFRDLIKKYLKEILGGAFFFTLGFFTRLLIRSFRSKKKAKKPQQVKQNGEMMVQQPQVQMMQQPEENKEEKQEKQEKQPTRNEKTLVFEFGGSGIKIAYGEVSSVNGQLDVKIEKKHSIYTYRIENNTEIDVTPKECIKRILDDFYTKDMTFSQIGIASFGPLCLDKSLKEYGNITTTPKPSWKHFPLTRQIQKDLSGRDVSVDLKDIKIDTDVNACAYAEFHTGNHGCSNSLAYITIGTGVGVGLVVNGQTVHGLQHPEGGHMYLQLLEEDYKWQGPCLDHLNCCESLVTNNAICQYLNQIEQKNGSDKKWLREDLKDVSDDHEVWKRVGFYLGQLCLNITLVVSPEVIILGGGVMKRKCLLGHIHQSFQDLLNGYLTTDRIKDIKNYIKITEFGDDIGLRGAMLLVQQ